MRTGLIREAAERYILFLSQKKISDKKEDVAYHAIYLKTTI